MVVNNKKSAIQLSIETPLPETLQEIPRLDEKTYKYLDFEMKKGEVDMKGNDGESRGAIQGQAS